MAHRPRAAHLIAGGLLAFCGAVAHAQFLYTCITANGKTVTGDRPPLECADRPIRIMGFDGTPKGTIEPPLTPEQRRKLDEEDKRKLDEEDVKRNQRQSDRSLLQTYNSVEEIEAARKRALADLQVFIDRALTRKGELQRDRKKLDNESEFFTKRELPEKLKRDLAANNESMKAQDKMITDTKAAMARVNQRYDAFVKRFKELLDRGATPVPRPTEEKKAPK